MAKTISEEDARDALSQVKHPEIDHTLAELEMVKNVVFKDDKVTLTLVLPFLQVPIKDYLVQSLRESVNKLGGDIEVEVKLTEMNQKERDRFMAMAQEAWIG